MDSRIYEQARPYVLGARLGAGQFSTVFSGYHASAPKVPLAIKVLDLESLFRTYPNYDKYLDRENNMMFMIKSSPNVVRLEHVQKTKDFMYIVMEFCPGGTLAQYLAKTGPLKEDDVRPLVRQIAMGLQDMYTLSMAHRDLKPANLLLSTNTSPFIIKIADFGFARVMQKDTVMNASLVGTPMYMAPEIRAKGQYSDSCDLWSVGIIMLEMLYGFRTASAVYEGLGANVELERMLPQSRNLSPRCKDLLSKLLQPVQTRISWVDFFTHPFIAESHPEISLLGPSGKDAIPTFSFPSLQTGTLELTNLPHDKCVLEWKKENNKTRSILILCMDTGNNKRLTEINMWDGVALNDTDLLIKLREAKSNSCLFIFDDQQFKAEDAFDTRVEPLVEINEPSASDWDIFLKESSQAGQCLYDDTMKVYHRCENFILTRELLEFGYRAFVRANIIKKGSVSERFLELFGQFNNISNKLKGQNELLRLTTDSIAQAEKITFLPGFLSPKSAAVKGLIDTYHKKLESAKAIETKIASDHEDVQKRLNLCYWRPPTSLGDAEKFAKMKDELNGEIFETQKTVAFFKNLIDRPNTVDTNAQLSEAQIAKFRDKIRARVSNLLGYSKTMNQKIRTFFERAIQTTLKDSVAMLQEVQKLIDQHRTLQLLAAEGGNDLQSLEQITRMLVDLDKEIADVAKFPSIPDVVDGFIKLLHNRQLYEQSIIRSKAKINTIGLQVHKRHVGELEDYYAQHADVLSKLFPGFSDLSALPLLSATETPNATLQHHHTEIPRNFTLRVTSPKTPNPKTPTKAPPPAARNDDEDVLDDWSFVYGSYNIDTAMRDLGEFREKLKKANQALAEEHARKGGEVGDRENDILRQRVQLYDKLKQQDEEGLRQQYERQLKENEEEKKKEEERQSKKEEEIERKYQALLRQFEDAKAESEAKSKIAAKFESEKAKVESEKANLVAEISKLEDENAKIAAEKAKFEAAVQAKIDTVAKSRDEAETRAKSEAEALAKIEKARAESEKARAESEEKAARLADEVSRLQQQQAEFENRQQEFQQKQQEWEEQKRALESNIALLKDNVMAYELSFEFTRQIGQPQNPAAQPPP